ncbi:MAG: hypothetical protein NPIRA02_40020 [Nitrospirales bacterium]|nr:MAG: hypothetical protein NPIRA02_40020 [Nitrospirales bacterium]
MTIEVGDFVIFTKTKSSSHPSPRAQEVYPAQHGDTYSYTINKFWKVIQVFDDNTIEIETRRGKRHRLDKNSPQLRKVTLWDRVKFRDRLF